MSTGAASAPGPSGCCGPAGCRHFREWDTRWSPATSWSAVSSKPDLPADFSPGQRVFVPGAKCFGEVRGLFGASASRLVVAAKRVVPIDQQLGERGILLALAATAYHAIAAKGASAPDCIVGHGVLGRLLARISIAVRNDPPTVWEKNPARASGAVGYGVIDPEHDTRRDYKNIYDVSGDASLLDSLIGRIAPGGEIVLAGFYSERLSFAFPPAFMREARLRVAAEWQQSDLVATRALIESGRLSLDGLITHRHRRERPHRMPIASPLTIPHASRWFWTGVRSHECRAANQHERRTPGGSGDRAGCPGDDARHQGNPDHRDLRQGRHRQEFYPRQPVLHDGAAGQESAADRLRSRRATPRRCCSVVAPVQPSSKRRRRRNSPARK